MDLLATSDARDVYKTVLSVIDAYAVTEDAADRIQVLTPLEDREAMTSRLDDVLAARETWAELDESDCEAVIDAFVAYDSVAGSDLPAVRTALELQDIGVSDGIFEPI
ncbi:MAG: DNA mismatch repair protein, partial [Bacteroidetes bacterium QH_2_63_10]